MTAAYSILSDYNKRTKYDSLGLSAMEESEKEQVVDVSQLGLFSTFAAALFTKIGVHVKTTIPASLLEQLYEGRFKAKRMKLGETFQDKVKPPYTHSPPAISTLYQCHTQGSFCAKSGPGLNLHISKSKAVKHHE